MSRKNIYIARYNLWGESICNVISVIFLTVYIASGKLTIKTLNILGVPFIFFFSWILTLLNYKENKEETRPASRVLLSCLAVAVVSAVLYMYFKNISFILIIVYSLVFLILGAGNRFKSSCNPSRSDLFASRIFTSIPHFLKSR